MTLKDRLLAIFIAFIWGINVITVKIALQDIPPILLGSLRFFFVAFPLIFFIKKPKVQFKYIFTFSCFEWFLKNILMFSALSMGLACGTASMIIQTQALFTMLLSSVFFGTNIKPYAAIGITIAFCGIVYLGHEMNSSVNFTGFLIALASALCWAIGNLSYKKMVNTNMLSVIVLSSAIPVIPYFIISGICEGTEPILTLYKTITWKTALCVFYLSFVSTHLASTLWGNLIQKYSPSSIAPYALLIPIFSIIIAWCFLNETLDKETIWACFIVFVGLAINQGIFNKKIFTKKM